MSENVNGLTLIVRRKRLSGWLMPAGIVLSVASNFFGLRPDTYTPVFVYAIGMFDVLVAFALYFLYRNGAKMAKELSISDRHIPLLETAALWVIAFGVFLFGWLLGDYIVLGLAK